MSDCFLIDQNVTTAIATQWFSPQGDTLALGPIGASPPQKLRDMPLEMYAILSGGNSLTAAGQWQVANNNTGWDNIGSAFAFATSSSGAVSTKYKLITLYKQQIRFNITAISGGRMDFYVRVKRT